MAISAETGRGWRGELPASGEVAARRGVPMPLPLPRPVELAIELTGEILPIMEVEGNPSPRPSRAGVGAGGVGLDR